MAEGDQHREQDKDPEPVKHADAERVGGQETKPEEGEDDRAGDPEERPLRDVEGG